ncbi:MAG: hypothetical protein A2X63_12110 [Ignavibacteria bacterium GWA2_35_8]|nr:MAG: hypothetical protein A2X63_12110 [Ignavibacteria bacterium GWA2_35_8]
MQFGCLLVGVQLATTKRDIRVDGNQRQFVAEHIGRFVVFGISAFGNINQMLAGDIDLDCQFLKLVVARLDDDGLPQQEQQVVVAGARLAELVGRVGDGVLAQVGAFAEVAERKMHSPDAVVQDEFDQALDASLIVDVVDVGLGCVQQFGGGLNTLASFQTTQAMRLLHHEGGGSFGTVRQGYRVIASLDVSG